MNMQPITLSFPAVSHNGNDSHGITYNVPCGHDGVIMLTLSLPCNESSTYVDLSDNEGNFIGCVSYVNRTVSFCHAGPGESKTTILSVKCVGCNSFNEPQGSGYWLNPDTYVCEDCCSKLSCRSTLS